MITGASAVSNIVPNATPGQGTYEEICDAATIIADIAANMPPDTLAGAVYLSGLLSTDTEIWQRVATPVPELMVLASDDSDAGARTKAHIAFTDLCFAKQATSSKSGSSDEEAESIGPLSPYWTDYCAWIGASVQAQATGAQFRWAVMHPSTLR